MQRRLWLLAMRMSMPKMMMPGLGISTTTTATGTDGTTIIIIITLKPKVATSRRKDKPNSSSWWTTSWAKEAASPVPISCARLSTRCTIAADSVSLMPLVVQAPVFPSAGLLMALAWRLLRPEMWGAWVALPLGFADDLITGAPLGSAMALWTLAFLMLDIADHRRVWRDMGVDWQLAAATIAIVQAGAWVLAWFSGGAGPLWTIVPQILLGILAFPAAIRLAAAMDRWRLGKGAATSR